MRNIYVFFFSLLVSLLALLVERMMGIDWDFHPDVTTYTTTYQDVVEMGWDAVPNRLYYFISAAVGGSVSALVSLNVLAYAITNVIIAGVFSRYCLKKGIAGKRGVVLLILLLFAPYRIHLAIHALKDTLIIMMLCIFLAYKRRFFLSWFAFLQLLMMRIYSGFYMLLLVRSRLLIFGVLLCAFVVVNFANLPLLDLLVERNESSMHSREFDAVPAFFEFGLMGTLLRMIFWPLLAVTGGFIFISPALLFIPIAFEIFVSRIWSYHVLGEIGLTIGLMLCLSTIAAVITSYTAYVRYVYPALVVMPIILMQRELLRSNSIVSRNKSKRLLRVS